MKILAWLGVFILVILVAVYTLVFTPFGNKIVGPMVESKIQKATKLDVNLSTFSLSLSDFEIVLALSKSNVVTLKGNYGLLSQSFDIAYRVKLEAIEELKSITNAPLSGRVFTNGTVKGDMAFISIDGASDIAKSDTTYHIELTDLNVTSVIAKVQKADLLSLLKLGGQSAYASAEINLDVNFKNIQIHQLDGNILLSTKDGKLDTKLMKKDFNVSIPKTAFSMNLDAKLKGEDIEYIYKLNSNLALVKSQGKVIPAPLKMDIKYSLDIKELAVLKPITSADIRGAFKLDGTLKGDKSNLIVNGKSDVASSNTVFSATLINFEPSSLQANITNLKLNEMLYMVKQAPYTDGLFSLDVDISDARMKTLKGTVVSGIRKGLLNSTYMTKAYEFKTLMPRTTYDMQTRTTLNKNIIDTKIDFNSNLATFDIKRARFNLLDASIVSDYTTTVLDLDKLFFATDRHMKGSITANGEFSKAKDLDLSIFSNIADGKLVANLHNDDFTAKLKGMQTLKVLDMLFYPKIFKSLINADVKYNLAQAKGVFDGKLSKGKFTQNQVLDIAKKYANTDMYKETFRGDVNAKINKEKIIASLDLKSNRSAIITKNTKLNTQTNTIASKININANGNEIVVKLSGDVNSPKVDIDTGELIKEEATKAITKEVSKFLKGLF